jgi:methionine sulfoxide reductase heme-binding subunit
VTGSPFLWFLNRGTGVVLLVLLTLVTVLGTVARGARTGGRLPGFVVPALHRNLSLLALALLAVHAGSAVVDEYVDIRWWQVLLPWRLAYEPWWLRLGTLATDLLLAVLVTSALRNRIGYRAWRMVHWTAYAAWVLGTVHGLGIGTDTSYRPARVVYLACAVAVAGTVLGRTLVSGVRTATARRAVC